MCDEPGRVDALGKHRVNPKVILRLRRLISVARITKTKAAEFRTHLRCKRATGESGAWNLFANFGPYTTRPAPNLRDWPIDSLAKPASDLKCRCCQFQVLSRGLTLASSRQDLLDKTTPILSIVGVKRCGLIGLNTLQGTRQRVLVLSGRMRCNGTKTDNSRSNQHCRDQAYGDLGLELFHWRSYRQYG